MKRVMQSMGLKLVEKNIFKSNELDYCLVGEPSSSDNIGDVIRNGRRGSITGHLVLKVYKGMLHILRKQKIQFIYVRMYYQIYLK